MDEYGAWLVVEKLGQATPKEVTLISSVGDQWHFIADPDPHLWLKDPESNSGSDSFLQWLWGCKKKFHIFSFQLTHRYIIFSLKNWIFSKNFLLKSILPALFQFAQHIYEKREGSGSGSESVAPVPLTNGSGSWRPQNMRNLRIGIPNTANKRGGGWWLAK
jgi:hypothetical protein